MINLKKIFLIKNKIQSYITNKQKLSKKYIKILHFTHKIFDYLFNYFTFDFSIVIIIHDGTRKICKIIII